mmetsp:Transcript_25289/g.28124  ORF Transcript_25289/g.28124 Transcript_25289/m.28124 type:complete len:347 (+) Transcript_25289:72-1112(+)
MTILFALVSKGTIVLASHATVKGNLDSIAQKILTQLPQSQDSLRKTYETGDYRFNILMSGGMTFLCMTDRAFSTRVSFHFLGDIYDKWLGRFGIGDNSVVTTGSKNDEFGRTLQKQMEYFSHDPNADKVRKVKEAVKVVKEQLVLNIDALLERGENIEALLTKTEELETGSYAFKSKATELKRFYWWKSCKLYFILVALLIIIAYGVSAYICKSPIYKGCWGKKHSSPTPSGAPAIPPQVPTEPPPTIPSVPQTTTKPPNAAATTEPPVPHTTTTAPQTTTEAPQAEAPQTTEPPQATTEAPQTTDAPTTEPPQTTEAPQVVPSPGSITIPSAAPTEPPSAPTMAA